MNVKRIHLALAIPHLRNGGAERTIAQIAHGLTERGHRVDVVVFQDGTAGGVKLPKGVRVVELKTERSSWFLGHLLVARAFGFRVACCVSSTLIGQAQEFATYLNQENPDCILPSLPKMKVAAFIASHIASRNQSIIPIVHSSLSRRGRKYQYLYSVMFPNSKKVVAVSDGVSGDLIKKLKLERGLIERIYNPVVSNEMEVLAEDKVDHPWLHDGGPPVLLAVGRLARVKDFPTLLRAFAQVAKARPVRLIVLGNGRWLQRLQNQARRLGVAGKVSFCGWVGNPFPFFRKASVFVLSSRYEGLGNVLIEALACGCPCVSTDCPHGPAEILENGRLGRLVPVGDATAMAKAIEQNLDSPPDKAVLRIRGQEFSVDKAIEHYERLIFDVIGE